MRTHLSLLMFGVLFTCGNTFAAPHTLDLRLKTFEKLGIEHSERLQGARHETSAQESKAEGFHTLLWPRMSLEGNYRYQSIVPGIPQPNGSTLFLGDNRNYSIGPSLTWTLLDFGGTRSHWKGQEILSEAKRQEERNLRRQVLVNTRLAYYRILSALDQQRLVTDSLRLANSQYTDIKNKYSAGTSSRIDLLSSHKEVLSFEIAFRQTQAELSAALQDLQRLAGMAADAFDFARPVAKSLTSTLPENLSSATILIDAEPLKDFELDFSSSQALKQHPQVVALGLQSESLESSAKGVRAGLFPKIQLQAKATWDYPNGPVLETIQQNTLMATVSMPLFEFSRTHAEAAEKRSLALSSRSRQEQVEKDLERDYFKARDQVAILKVQRALLKNISEEATELARLTYSAYQNGRSSFLEVQSANLKALDTRVQISRNDIQILIQQTLLQSLVSEN